MTSRIWICVIVSVGVLWLRVCSVSECVRVSVCVWLSLTSVFIKVSHVLPLFTISKVMSCGQDVCVCVLFLLQLGSVCLCVCVTVGKWDLGWARHHSFSDGRVIHDTAGHRVHLRYNKHQGWGKQRHSAVLAADICTRPVMTTRGQKGQEKVRERTRERPPSVYGDNNEWQYPHKCVTEAKLNKPSKQQLQSLCDQRRSIRWKREIWQQTIKQTINHRCGGLLPPKYRAAGGGGKRCEFISRAWSIRKCHFNCCSSWKSPSWLHLQEKQRFLMHLCGLIGHQDNTESLSLAYRGKIRQGEWDSVIVTITSVTYPQTGNTGKGSN